MHIEAAAVHSRSRRTACWCRSHHCSHAAIDTLPQACCNRSHTTNYRPQRQGQPNPGIKVVGCGSCGVDYLASIAAFPKPDQKLRTDQLEVQGGGNCANALTAAARLGLAPVVVSKIGGDGLGDGIISELQADGVDTSLLLRAPGHPSPFTYIIVDREGGTRTCIHTPGAPMVPEEMTQPLIDAALEGAALVYFDGRLTEAALLLARAARRRGVAVLVEGERLRPGLDLLLGEADYVVTSAHFPQEWTGEATLGDALLSLAGRLPRCKVLITTRGTQGAVMLERSDPAAAAAAAATQQSSSAEEQPLHQVLSDLTAGLQQPASTHSSEPACTSASGQQLQLPPVASTPGALRLSYSSGRDPAAAAAQVQAAAAAAAAMNADAGNAGGYAMVSTQAAAAGPLLASVMVAAAAALPKEAVADTTGAGDAFIGTVLYGLVTGLPRQHMLQLASVVAACKCTALGARPGLPRREQLRVDVLGAGPAAAAAGTPAAQPGQQAAAAAGVSV